jgi:hypothetical protein
VCGSCWDTSTLLPTTLYHFLGFVRNQNKLWEPLEDNPLTGQMLLLCPAIVVRKNKKCFSYIKKSIGKCFIE